MVVVVLMVHFYLQTLVTLLQKGFKLGLKGSNLLCVQELTSKFPVQGSGIIIVEW